MYHNSYYNEVVTSLHEFPHVW